MGKLLTFTSDFGADSHYVAQMKAAALRLAPDATCLDITHSIRPQDVAEGAVVLQDCLPHFPAGSAHVAVVDPGVGTERAIVAADLDGRVVVAPDNGLLSLAIRGLPLRQAVRVEHRPEFGGEPSATFHGRDLIAPAAALICRGLPLEQLGPPLAPQTLPIKEPEVREDGVRGEVVLIDNFGNLITNIFRDQLPRPPLEIRCGGARIGSLRTTYGLRAGELVALIGSSGRLEVAVVQGSAARQLNVARGEPVEAEREDAASGGRPASMTGQQ